MIKFTKEEISLCKQVAEKWRKEIDWGDIVDGKKGIGIVATISVSPHGKKTIFIDCYQGKIPHYEEKEENLIPLWTISGCLEFLRERAFYLEGLCQTDECEHEICISEMDDMGVVRHSERRFQGKTELEACLKTVKAVLEDKD